MGHYEITTGAGQAADSGMLTVWFGSLWRNILDRLNNAVDGYVMSLHFQGNEYRIYRKQ